MRDLHAQVLPPRVKNWGGQWVCADNNPTDSQTVLALICSNVYIVIIRFQLFNNIHLQCVNEKSLFLICFQAE